MWAIKIQFEARLTVDSNDNEIAATVRRPQQGWCVPTLSGPRTLASTSATFPSREGDAAVSWISLEVMNIEKRASHRECTERRNHLQGVAAGRIALATGTVEREIPGGQLR